MRTYFLKELFGKQVLATFQSNQCAWVFSAIWPKAGGKAGYLLSHLYRQAGLTRLKHYGMRAIQLRAKKSGGLHLNQSTELGVKIFKHVITTCGSLN
jgi:hypothetical protein